MNKPIFFICMVIFFSACSRKTVPTSYVEVKPAIIETAVFSDTIAYTPNQENYKSYIPPVDEKYWQAMNELEQMFEREDKLNFKRAVFIAENAYLNEILDYEIFNKNIFALSQICVLMTKANRLIYPYEDSSKVAKYAAVFKLMTEGVPILNNNDTVRFAPYKYDFDDFAGNQEWTQMFVTKILDTHKGNCHSLPFLYKIIVQELGENANLALAPNHIYIKHNIKNGGWYNTELTSGIFPNDSWLMASGYIKLEAIQNGVFLKALDEKQSIAICVTDLALGYERKFGIRSGDFILKCCDLALKHFPNYINALLLKSETEKKLLDKKMKEHNFQSLNELFYNPEMKQLYDDMNNNFLTIHKLGYRKMPDKMYSEWLITLKTEKEKYQNKNINFTNQKNSK